MAMRLPEDILRGLEQLEAQFAEALSMHSALVGGTQAGPQRAGNEDLAERGPRAIEQLRQRLAEVGVGEGEGEYLSQAAAAILRETRAVEGTVQEVKLEMLRNVLAQTADADAEHHDRAPASPTQLRPQSAPAASPRRHRKKRKGTRPAEADDWVSSSGSRPTVQMASQPSPSPAAKGKKPMAYPQHSQQVVQSQQQQQQQPRSERAASKAPLGYQAPTTAQNRQSSPPSSNTSKSRNTTLVNQKGKANANKIWSTSTTEERERIKEFWLGLSEEERRDLVKIEKDTVLKKMKEQQKHSCSCAVCGRKRNAIEEELEVLYDAYYEELEQYANHQQRYVNSGGTIPPPPGPGPFPGSVELDKNGAVVSHIPPNNNGDSDNNVSAGGGGGGKTRGGKQRQQPPSINGRIAPPTAHHDHDHVHLHPHHNHHHHKESEFEDDEGDVYEEEEEYEEEDEEEEDEDEEDEDEDEDEDGKLVNGRRKATRQIPAGRKGVIGKGERRANGKQRDGFNLTNLAVSGPGNILTVADDLLKNDGQKFLEMMEQLAERRMQREEEAAADVEEDSEEDSEDDDGSDVDDGEDGEGGSEDEEDEEDEDEEIMTEEQKMEEGKRMFSIFAARMFEQRVLQAYREKVAQERQMQLLRELEDEDKLTKEREQKKQNANQRKKDKKRQQKLAREEEKAAKAAEKAAEEAAVKARQAAIEEENKRRREEERAKREATRKAVEEEKARKEEEKRKRMQEEREREAARELKRKEREERLRAERREKEEKERKVKEEKEARLAKEREEKEKEKREREEKEEKERIEKEKKALKDKEEREAKEKLVAQQRVVTVTAGSSSAKQVVRNVPPATSPVKSNSSGLVTSGSSPAGLQRSPNTSVNSAITNNLPTLAKKGSYSSNKPPALSASISSPNILVNPNRAPPPPHLAQISQPGGSSSRGPPGISQPPTPHTPQLPHSSHAPPTPGMMFGSQGQPGGMMSPPALSPRLANYGHGALGSGHVSFGFSAAGGGPPTPQHPSHLGVHSHQPQPQQLQPSALPRGTFTNGPTSFDPTFQRVSGGGFAPGTGLPSPIGPPSKPKTPMTAGPSGSPTIPGVPSLAPGSGRRSVHDLPVGSNASGGAALGPISRPIAPIARPTGLIGTDNTSPGSNSPVRRSPSPKGIVLGSSALASVDDEVMPVAARRSIATTPFGASSIGGVGIGVSGVNVGVIGQPHWGSSSPRGDALGRSGPWGSTSVFSAAPGSRPGAATSIGTSGMINHNHNHHSNTLHPISGSHHHPQHSTVPPGVPPGNTGTFSLWRAPAPASASGANVDWHTGPPGPPGIIGTPFFNNAAPFMGHNHNTTPGSPVTHSGAGAGGGA